MVGYKTVRASKTPDYEDNVKDIEGYALMFREIIGSDMIAAVNTDEYLLEKSRRGLGKGKPCSGCGWLQPAAPAAGAHALDCAVAELNRHVRTYNGRFNDELQESPAAQTAQLLKEVPSYQPGPNASPQHLMEVYRGQLRDIFCRAWKDRGPTVPVEKFAEIAAREAVEYFWLTFQRNAQFEAAVREHPAV
jgi:hypothetical protein